MSFPLSTLGLSLPSSIHNRKSINHFAVPCNTKLYVCNAWGSKCAAAAKKNDHTVDNTKLSLQLDLDRRRQTLKQLVTNCSKLCGAEDIVSQDKGSEEDDMMKKYEEVYSVLKSEILNDPDFEWTPESRLWVQQMLDYNVPRGVLFSLYNRMRFTGEFGPGLYVVSSYKLLKEGEELSEDEVFNANVVEWCIRWIAACGLIVDDLIDSSYTRNDEPCWFRVPKVGNIAINDAVLLMAHVPRILKKHFREKPYYVDLLHLFNDIVFRCTSGQMLDVITPDGERDLSNYTMHHYRHIAQYKAGYAVYAPAACALLMAGENLENHVNMKDVCLEIGIYFQIVNDYLDCFGNTKITGKVGNDIECFKCSWPVVKALELANEEQKKILHDHYGKANPSDVAKVKAVYDDIDLQLVFAMNESMNYDNLASCVEAPSNKALRGIWESLASYRQVYKMQAFN